MIAIKGMEEMPKSCSECNLCVEDKYADMTCVLLGKEWEETDYNENNRDENCPLVEIVICKDCKYNDEGTCHIDGFTVCDDFFCASARRKDKMSEEELERIKKEEFRKGVSSVVYGTKNYPNDFKVEIFALDEDKSGK